MHVGIGCTALHRSTHNAGRLDGISMYSRALLQNLPNEGLKASEAIFSDKNICSDSVYRFSGGAKKSILLSALTNRATKTEHGDWSKFDLFHATDHFIPKLKDIPTVATLMDPIPLMNADWVDASWRSAKNWVFKRSVHWANYYITISKFVISDLVEFFNIDESLITPIHLGVDDIYFHQLDSEYKKSIINKFGLNSNFLLFIGTLQPRKNINRIIDAFESLPIQLQKEFPLVVVGKNGWSADVEIKRLLDLNAKGVAYWLDYISEQDKLAILQSATALVFPSLYEGFGLPVLEAFASGLPVITSNISSLPEVAGDAALLVDPYDSEQIADAISQVIENRDLAKKMRALGIARAKEFTWSKTAKNTAAIYRKIINR